MDKNVILNKKYYCYRDGYGLTPLHYAFILGNENEIERILRSLNINESILNVEHSLELAKMYGVVSVITNKEKYLEQIIMGSDDMYSLLKSKKAIQRSISIQKTLLKTVGLAITFAEKQLSCLNDGVDEDLIQQQYGNISDVGASCDELEQNIINLEEQLFDIEREIFEFKRFLVEKYKKYAREVIAEVEPIYKIYRMIYTDSNVLRNSFSGDAKDFYYVNIKGEYVYINERIFSKTESKVEYDGDLGKSKESFTNIKKKYGDSWFSQEARNNMKQLSKEYHKLAVEYHPDNNPNTVAIFLDIQKERAEILEYLSENGAMSRFSTN